jgi:hypothetical protein
MIITIVQLILNIIACIFLIATLVDLIATSKPNRSIELIEQLKKDRLWTHYIRRHLRCLQRIDKTYYTLHTRDGYFIVTFLYSGLIEIYSGEKPNDIRTSYALGGVSIYADSYLTTRRAKHDGKIIERWYLSKESSEVEDYHR